MTKGLGRAQVRILGNGTSRSMLIVIVFFPFQFHVYHDGRGGVVVCADMDAGVLPDRLVVGDVKVDKLISPADKSANMLYSDLGVDLGCIPGPRIRRSWDLGSQAARGFWRQLAKKKRKKEGKTEKKISGPASQAAKNILGPCP